MPKNQPILSISQDGTQVVLHEHGPLPVEDAALLLARALAVLLADAKTRKDSHGLVTL